MNRRKRNVLRHYLFNFNSCRKGSINYDDELKDASMNSDEDSMFELDMIRIVVVVFSLEMEITEQ
jgi:hypothetical protein